MATRVLIVEDHLAVRQGIRSPLVPEADFVVVGEAADGNDALAKALALSLTSSLFTARETEAPIRRSTQNHRPQDAIDIPCRTHPAEAPPAAALRRPTHRRRPRAAHRPGRP